MRMFLMVSLVLAATLSRDSPSHVAGRLSLQTPVACASATPDAGATPATRATPRSVAAQRIDLGGETGEALVWDGGGHIGTVLVHGAVYDAASWDEQATAMTEAGISVIGVEQLSEVAVVAAVEYLRNDLGVDSTTLVGASAGGSAVLGALSGDVNLADRLILLSSTGDVSTLDGLETLFIASEGEGMADRVEEIANEVEDGASQVLIVPGDAHAQAIFDSAGGDDVLQAMIAFIVSGCP